MRLVPQWCTCSQECRCVKDLHSEWEFVLTALQSSTVGGTPMQIKPQLAPYLTPSLARSLPPTSFLIAHQEFCLISSPASVTHLLPIITHTFNFDVLLLLHLFFPLWLFANLYLLHEAFLKWENDKVKQSIRLLLIIFLLVPSHCPLLPLPSCFTRWLKQFL